MRRDVVAQQVNGARLEGGVAWSCPVNSDHPKI